MEDQNKTKIDDELELDSVTDASTLPTEIPGDPASPVDTPSPAIHKRAWRWTKNLTKKQKIIFGAVVLALLGGACASAMWILNKQAEPLPSTTVAQQPTEVPSHLTGIMVKPEEVDKQVTGVMIENSPDARPQAGLIDAEIVFEAVAEGGITRFLALYQNNDSKYLGPIRSVRPYYLDWLVPYGGALAHVGGAPEAIAQIKRQNIKDLDQFNNPNAYDRVSARIAPHNVYSSTKRLQAIEKQKKYNKSVFEGFERDKKEKPIQTPKVKTINLSLSGPLYDVTYKYDKKNNSYDRVLGGAAHKDEKSGKQISPKVVIAMEIKRSQDGVYSVYAVNGSGKVRVYQNGKMIIGKWKKKNRKSEIQLLDKENNPIKLAPGKTWITAVEPGRVTQK
ncbi:MAG TPA: DUF3048 domain-containing protein [Candidatus Saccharibacteria bacterium]|nr:DUF3048 domain-containing protein [Candidatus Saccharibacteria bacterium]